MTSVIGRKTRNKIRTPSHPPPHLFLIITIYLIPYLCSDQLHHGSIPRCLSTRSIFFTIGHRRHHYGGASLYLHPLFCLPLPHCGPHPHPRDPRAIRIGFSVAKDSLYLSLHHIFPCLLSKASRVRIFSGQVPWPVRAPSGGCNHPEHVNARYTNRAIDKRYLYKHRN